MLIRRRVIAAKLEAVEGTAETLTNTDCGVLVYEPKIELPPNFFQRDPVRDTFSLEPALPGPQSMKLTFRAEVMGSGAAGTAPSWGKYLRACGFDEAIVASTSVTYTPKSLDPKSLTMALYEDGVCFKMKGVRGNVKFSAKVGQPMFMDFEFTGVYVSTTDVAIPSPITYPSTIPVAFLGSNIVTVHTYNPVFTAFDLDMANTVALRESVNDASGYLSSKITGRAPKGTIDPEMTFVSGHDWVGKFRAGTVAAATIALTGSAGNIVNISMPKLQYREIGDAERNGISARAIGFQLARNASAGDDEISIALT